MVTGLSAPTFPQGRCMTLGTSALRSCWTRMAGEGDFQVRRTLDIKLIWEEGG